MSHTQGVNPTHISIHTCISIDSSTCRGSGSSIELFIQLASMRLPCFHIHIYTSWVYSLLYTICIYLSVLSIYDFVVSQILRLRRLYITDPGRNTCEAFLNSIATLLCVCVWVHMGCTSRYPVKKDNLFILLAYSLSPSPLTYRV